MPLITTTQEPRTALQLSVPKTCQNPFNQCSVHQAVAHSSFSHSQKGFNEYQHICLVINKKNCFGLLHKALAIVIDVKNSALLAPGTPISHVPHFWGQIFPGRDAAREVCGMGSSALLLTLRCTRTRSMASGAQRQKRGIPIRRVRRIWCSVGIACHFISVKYTYVVFSFINICATFRKRVNRLEKSEGAKAA